MNAKMEQIKELIQAFPSDEAAQAAVIPPTGDVD